MRCVPLSAVKTDGFHHVDNNLIYCSRTAIYTRRFKEFYV
jgi:hypothetical protein